MSQFRAVPERVPQALFDRQRVKGNKLTYGITFLDDALGGVYPTDLVLFGSATGAGKTQFCTNIASINAAKGKRVHMFALEAYQNEIEDRLEFMHVTSLYKKNNPEDFTRFCYQKWYDGDYDKMFLREINHYIDNKDKLYTSLNTYYKGTDFFDVDLFEQKVFEVAEHTDLIIIDHAHVFDWEETNDNRALKKIAQTCRTVALQIRKPIILVAHLRKSIGKDKELVPGIDEFHGSSDLSKICTVAITIARGDKSSKGIYGTYFRICKNRLVGERILHTGHCWFNTNTNTYREEYSVGRLNWKEFKEYSAADVPSWARRSIVLSKKAASDPFT